VVKTPCLLKNYSPKTIVMKIKFILMTSSLLLVQSALFSQSENTLESQFDEIYLKSNNYQDYKVVEKNKLLALKKNTIDSIVAYREVIAGLQSEIDSQKMENGLLQNNLKEVEKNFTIAIEQRDEFNFLGIGTTKGTYSSIVWTLIAIFAFLAGLFIFKFQNNNKNTRILKQNLKETEDEFESYKQRALEREQLLNRKLHDERKKTMKNND